MSIAASPCKSDISASACSEEGWTSGSELSVVFFGSTSSSNTPNTKRRRMKEMRAYQRCTASQETLLLDDYGAPARLENENIDLFAPTPFATTKIVEYPFLSPVRMSSPLSRQMANSESNVDRDSTPDEYDPFGAPSTADAPENLHDIFGGPLRSDGRADFGDSSESENEADISTAADEPASADQSLDSIENGDLRNKSATLDLGEYLQSIEDLVQDHPTIVMPTDDISQSPAKGHSSPIAHNESSWETDASEAMSPVRAAPSWPSSELQPFVHAWLSRANKAVSAGFGDQDESTEISDDGSIDEWLTTSAETSFAPEEPADAPLENTDEEPGTEEITIQRDQAESTSETITIATGGPEPSEGESTPLEIKEVKLIEEAADETSERSDEQDAVQAEAELARTVENAPSVSIVPEIATDAQEQRRDEAASPPVSIGEASPPRIEQAQATQASTPEDRPQHVDSSTPMQDPASPSKRSRTPLRSPTRVITTIDSPKSCHKILFPLSATPRARRVFSDDVASKSPEPNFGTPTERALPIASGAPTTKRALSREPSANEDTTQTFSKPPALLAPIVPPTRDQAVGKVVTANGTNKLPSPSKVFRTESSKTVPATTSSEPSGGRPVPSGSARDQHAKPRVAGRAVQHPATVTSSLKARVPSDPAAKTAPTSRAAPATSQLASSSRLARPTMSSLARAPGANRPGLSSSRPPAVSAAPGSLQVTRPIARPVSQPTVPSHRPLASRPMPPTSVARPPSVLSNASGSSASDKPLRSTATSAQASTASSFARSKFVPGNTSRLAATSSLVSAGSRPLLKPTSSLPSQPLARTTQPVRTTAVVSRPTNLSAQSQISASVVTVPLRSPVKISSSTTTPHPKVNETVAPTPAAKTDSVASVLTMPAALIETDKPIFPSISTSAATSSSSASLRRTKPGPADASVEYADGAGRTVRKATRATFGNREKPLDRAYVPAAMTLSAPGSEETSSNTPSLSGSTMTAETASEPGAGSSTETAPRRRYTFHAAPDLTQDELSQLTQRNSKKNCVQYNKIEVDTIFVDAARPPSPTAKIRKSIQLEGSLGRPTTKEGREARAAKRRNALRSSVDGSESDLVDREIAVETATTDVNDLDGPLGASQAQRADKATKHFRGAGDDEDYESPVRKRKSTKGGNGSAGTSGKKKSSVVGNGQKRVKWDRALVYHRPVTPPGETDSIIKVRTTPLDEFGNSKKKGGNFGAPVKVIIVKRVYKDDE